MPLDTETRKDPDALSEGDKRLYLEYLESRPDFRDAAQRAKDAADEFFAAEIKLRNALRELASLPGEEGVLAKKIAAKIADRYSHIMLYIPS